jgi:protein SCO1/2
MSKQGAGTKSKISRRFFLVVPAFGTAAVASFLAFRNFSANAPFGGPFSLTDGFGRTVSDKDFLGKYLLVYFGYTFCPDVCPTALGQLSGVLGNLDAGQLEKVEVIFISVDPKRDFGERLAAYGPAFHPKITGLTGKQEEIDRVAAAFGAKYKIAGDPASDDYAIDHTSIIYVIGPDGKFQTQFTHNATPDQILKKLVSVLQ